MKFNTVYIASLCIIIGSLLGLMLHIYKPWQLLGKKSSTLEIGELKNRILVPIEINGIICNFLWDTGADFTMVSKSIMTKCNIEHSGQEAIGIMYTNKIKSRFDISKAILLKMGDFEINSTVAICPYPLSLDFDSVAIDGILGQDIISKFYWSFDFDTHTAIVSNKEIYQAQEPDFILPLLKDFDNDSVINRKPFAGILFNDDAKLSFFDSGMAGKAFSTSEFNEEHCIFSDMLIAIPDSSDLNFLEQFMSSLDPNIIRITGSYKENGTPELLYVITKNLKLNDLNPAVYLIAHEVDSYHGAPMVYLTANFMRRFGRMYYDPQDRTVEFYKSSQIDSRGLHFKMQQRGDQN